MSVVELINPLPLEDISRSSKLLLNIKIGLSEFLYSVLEP